MNEIVESIKTRRSVRSFTDKAIPDDVLGEIISAGMYAPSAMNTQPWHITVVADEDKLETLRSAIALALNRSDYKRFYGAPVLAIVGVPGDYKHGQADSSCVLENMFLAAHALGVGSVWIDQLRGCCNDPAVRKILTSLGIPENYVVYGSGAFGYSDLPISGDRENKGTFNIVK